MEVLRISEQDCNLEETDAVSNLHELLQTRGANSMNDIQDPGLRNQLRRGHFFDDFT